MGVTKDMEGMSQQMNKEFKECHHLSLFDYTLWMALFLCLAPSHYVFSVRSMIFSVTVTDLVLYISGDMVESSLHLVYLLICSFLKRYKTYI